jgi:PAS domain S-box-containing protein
MLFDRAAIALVAADGAFRIVCWNRAAEAIFGRPAAEMIGQPIDCIAPPDRRGLLGRLLRRTARRGQTARFEVPYTPPDGPQRDLVVMLSPVPLGAGDPAAVAAWIIDDTHRRQLGEQLVQAEKMASLGTLASGVAHHFNNILGGVATFVDYALTSGDGDAMRRALQMTAEAAARASEITRSLLSFAARDAGKSDLADLTEAVLTFAHLVERPLAERGIRFRLDLQPAPVVPVQGASVHQVLGHLLRNAEEAMPAGGDITVALCHVGEEVQLRFRDTGAGIRRQHLPHVFEPFFTTKGLLSGGQGGHAGLGLSVVHGLVQALGGRLEVTSEPGEFTEFTIRVPTPAAAGAD